MPCAFGPFEVLARIATTRISQTFIALHVGADAFRRTVSLKTLQPELCKDDRAKNDFANGAKLAAKLNHPACVGVESFGQERAIYYLTTEYVPGETWKSVLARAGRTHDIVRPEIVAHIIAELCEGLHHAHELGGASGSFNIVHRGIEPNNIMIDDNGRPRIVDFATGKSTLSHDSTETGIIKGSFRYMSPEQIIGKVPDRRCDIYGLGEVLFESLTPPSAGELKLEQLASSKLDEHPRLREFTPEIDEELDTICARALAVEPTERYQTAAEMHAALVNYLKNKRCTKARAMLSEAMEKLCGSEIAKRTEVMRKLSFGSYDLSELLYTLRGEAASERDIFEGSRGRFDEESFLATIKPGQMENAPPPPGAKPSLAEAKLHLRGPRAVGDKKTPPPAIKTPPPAVKTPSTPASPPKPAPPAELDTAELEEPPADPEPTSWSALIDIGDPDW